MPDGTLVLAATFQTLWNLANEIESRYPTSVWPEDSQHPEARVAAGVRLACAQIRHAARQIWDPEEPSDA